ncbi:uncharacterized protein LOC110028724 [Phalaenopsis equestris]|uniref:uncharacterized protein LOC110028724 n=1 Tax=Phalaenopsis equestris TaxID=78828 RepID=UPI0009E24B23|nr:uncharacterized protein LOC110028724 [Phalaenopsis equestris]
MDLKMASSIVTLLISLIFADARHYSAESMLLMPEGDAKCNSCLEASRKAERALKDMKLFKEFDVLSSEVCHVLPEKLETQCLEQSKIQIRHTEQSLLGFLHEKSLCNITGLCVEQQRLQDEIEIIVENNASMELKDETDCIACRRAVKDLLMKMKQPKMKTKIIEALIDYCEEAEDNEQQCKQTVYKYASTVLNKLERLKSNDLCVMMGMCDEAFALVDIMD